MPALRFLVFFAASSAGIVHQARFRVPEAMMKPQETKGERTHPEENDPSPDLSREDAAFERERPSLVRDHLGKVALVHGDDVAGVFENANDAIVEGCRRFGRTRIVCYLITQGDQPEYIANVDINHPSFAPLE
jgi:hypothetical protein